MAKDGRDAAENPPPDWNDALDKVPVGLAVERLLAAVRGRLTDQDYQTVVQICANVQIGFRGGSGSDRLSDPSAFRLRQIALAYLPEALDAYLAVPAEFSAKPQETGKSPRDLFVGQLELLEEGSRRAAEILARADTDRLEAHGRFLSEAFGRSGFDLPNGRVGRPDAGDDSR